MRRRQLAVLESGCESASGNTTRRIPPTTRIPAMRTKSEGRMEGERRNSMRKHATAWAFFLILLVAAVIGSCAKPYHEETEKYYFVATNIDLPYWQEAQAGFLDAAKN